MADTRVLIAAVQAALEAGGDGETTLAIIQCIVDGVRLDMAEVTAGYGLIGRLVTEGDFSVVVNARPATDAQEPAR